jgi:glycosyltransferase involved in cell wall biosynthesis
MMPPPHPLQPQAGVGFATPLRMLMTLDAVGGVWRYAVDLARGLGQREVECLLVGFGPPPGPDKIAEIESIANTSLVWPGEALDWLANDESELDGVARVLARLARDWRPNLLHLNLPSQAVGLPEDTPPLVVASHSCLASWWMAVRGDDPLPAGWDWQRRRTRDGLRRADRVVVPSESHAQATIAAYGRVERLDIVHNASPSAHGAPERQDVFLAAGRWWDEGKNGATLDAAARLISWPALMAGSTTGPNGQCCRLENARTLGELPGPAVAAWMEQAAVFVAPSLYEPFGLAVLEAAHRGAALVLADIPTFRELWQDAALFVPARDPRPYAEAIDRLMRDKVLRSRLARQARLRALDFTPERQIDGMLRVYSRALGGLSGANPIHPSAAAEFPAARTLASA